MLKKTLVFALLLVAIVAINVGITQWLMPEAAPVPDSSTDAQLTRILQGINKQSTSITSLENNLKQLGGEIDRINNQANEQQAEQSTAIAALKSQLAGLTPASTAETAIPNDDLNKINKQFADLQQQLSALAAAQNRLLPDDESVTPDPYAGMTPEQIKQQQEARIQQEIEQLNTIVTTTGDLGKTSQVSDNFQKYIESAGYTTPPPRVACGTSVCHFQFEKKNIQTPDGEEMDAMMVLMESGTFPADGTQRTIVSRENGQGGMDLYVGNSEDFPNTSGQ